MIDDSQEVTVPAASRAGYGPQRSLYRAVELGEIPSTTRDGVKCVRVGDLRAWAERRVARRQPPPPPPPADTGDTASTATPAGGATAEAPSAPATGLQALPPSAATAGNVAADVGGRPLGNTPPPPSDGALASRLFAAFEEGRTPADLVVAEQLPPGLVKGLWLQYQDLRGAAGDRKTLVQRIEALEEAVRSLEQRMPPEFSPGYGGRIFFDPPKT
jgi:hypothetical protein